MHMADALLSPAVAVTMYAASTAAIGYSVHGIRKESRLSADPVTKKLPTMAVMSALVFAGQMINFTIPGTGSSGHLCGGLMLAALLGPYGGMLAISVILAIQCLFFADGGLTALGANIWNMGFYGCFVGYCLIFRPLMNSGLFGKSKNSLRTKILVGSVLANIVSLQLGAFSVVLETSISGITSLPFGTFVALMQPIHLAIGTVEGLITAAVLIFICEARPEMLDWMKKSESRAENRMSLRNVVIVLSALTLVTAGGLSLLASSYPDGLEWSVAASEEKTGIVTDENGNSLSAGAESIIDKTALMADYSTDGSGEKGTSVAGLVGSAGVAVVAAGIYFVGRLNSKKKEKA